MIIFAGQVVKSNSNACYTNDHRRYNIFGQKEKGRKYGGGDRGKDDKIEESEHNILGICHSD